MQQPIENQKDEVVISDGCTWEQAEELWMKAADAILIPAKKFFGTSHNTRDFMEEYQIAAKKKEHERYATRGEHMGTKYYENDGVIFYTNHFREKKVNCVTITEMTTWSCLSGGTSWRFGLVKPDGTIYLLFNGNWFHGNERSWAIGMLGLLQKGADAAHISGTLFIDKN